MRASIALLLAALCSAALADAPNPNAPSGVQASVGATTGPSIAVAGGKLVDGSGAQLQLLGTSISGLEQGSSSLANGVENYGNAADAGFKAMASWNMNVVRVPLSESSWLGKSGCITDGGSASTLQANVAQAVSNANAAGLYVILDLHWTAPNSFGCPHGQGSMPDADNTVAFWTSVANAFKGNPGVIFELFNEPFGTNVFANWVQAPGTAPPSGQSATDLDALISGGTYSNGYMYDCNNNCNLTKGSIYTAPGTAPFQAAGYQTIIDAIRATGAKNVILANAIGWAGQIQTWLAKRPSDPAGQLAVGWHIDGGSTAQASQVMALGLPVVITEAYAVGDANFTWSVANKAGFLYWAWVDWGGSGLLINAKTSAPSATGTALKNSYCTRPSVNSLARC